MKGQTYRYAGKEASFRDAQKDTGNQQAVVVLYDSHQGHDGAPGDHDKWEPAAGTELLEKQVAWYLERCVREEEDGQAPVVLSWLHSEVFLKALDLCIAYIATWDPWGDVSLVPRSD